MFQKVPKIFVGQQAEQCVAPGCGPGELEVYESRPPRRLHQYVRLLGQVVVDDVCCVQPPQQAGGRAKEGRVFRAGFLHRRAVDIGSLKPVSRDALDARHVGDAADRAQDPRLAP